MLLVHIARLTMALKTHSDRRVGMVMRLVDNQIGLHSFRVRNVLMCLYLFQILRVGSGCATLPHHR